MIFAAPARFFGVEKDDLVHTHSFFLNQWPNKTSNIIILFYATTIGLRFKISFDCTRPEAYARVKLKSTSPPPTPHTRPVTPHKSRNLYHGIKSRLRHRKNMVKILYFLTWTRSEQPCMLFFWNSNVHIKSGYDTTRHNFYIGAGTKGLGQG